MEVTATTPWVVILAFWVTLTGSTSQFHFPNAESASWELALQLSRAYLLHFNGLPAKADVKLSGIEIDDISFPILPPLPDPWNLEDSEIVIPDEGGFIHGSLNTTATTITGLGDIDDLLTVSPTPDYEFLLDYSVKLPDFKIFGKHDALVTLTSGPTEIESHGDYSLAITNASIDLRLKVKILLENKISVSSVNLVPGFDALVGYTSETFVNGVPLNWDDFNDSINNGFPEFWETIGPTINSILRLVLNSVLEDCVLTDLIKGNLECILGGGVSSTAAPEPTTVVPTEVVPTEVVPTVSDDPPDNTASPPPATTEPSSCSTLRVNAFILIALTALYVQLR